MYPEYKKITKISQGKDGELVQIRQCAKCLRVIAVYPSPGMTVQKFNPLKFCPKCKKEIDADYQREWKEERKKGVRVRNCELKKQTALLREETERMRENAVLAEQERARLIQQIIALGGTPDIDITGSSGSGAKSNRDGLRTHGGIPTHWERVPESERDFPEQERYEAVPDFDVAAETESMYKGFKHGVKTGGMIQRLFGRGRKRN